MVSLPGIRAWGAARGLSTFPPCRARVRLCKSPPTHTPAPFCSAPGPARSPGNLCQRAWYPHRSGCPKRLLSGREWVGTISSHLGPAPKLMPHEPQLEVGKGGWGMCVFCVHGHHHPPSVLMWRCHFWTPHAQAPCGGSRHLLLPGPVSSPSSLYPSLRTHVYLHSASSVGVCLSPVPVCERVGPASQWQVKCGWGSTCAGTQPVALPRRVCESSAPRTGSTPVCDCNEAFNWSPLHLALPGTSCHPAPLGNPANRSLKWAAAEHLRAQISLRVAKCGFFDTSELPLCSSLLVSNGSFLPSPHAGQRSRPPVLFGGEGVRDRGPTPSQDLLTRSHHRGAQAG